MTNYTCFNCNKEFTPKNKPANLNKPFCSRSCAATHNNLVAQKRFKQGKCKSCEEPVGSGYTYCKKCFTYNTGAWQHKTIKQIKAEYPRIQAHAKIRGYSYTVYKSSNKPKYCCNCGYDKHYEVCHIKAIKDFSDESTLGEVHHIDNLIALCRNCHWEYDHNLLVINHLL